MSTPLCPHIVMLTTLPYIPFRVRYDLYLLYLLYSSLSAGYHAPQIPLS